jgi:AmmeMemoRadiSam system protein B
MNVKRSTIAGTWYPAAADVLRETIDGWLNRISVRGAPPGAAIVPHAGYQYSGAVAAAAYAHWQNAPVDRVIVLAPSHRGAFRGVAVPDADAFETPLGTVAIDPAVRDLTRGPLIRTNSSPFDGEHALEIQLPFLQRVLPQVPIIPLLLGYLDETDDDVLAAALETIHTRSTVTVVSSDFTHYGRRFDYQPFPADDAAHVSERLRALDQGAIEPILAGDASGFRQYVGDTGITVCGRGPIGAFLTWARCRYRGELVAYQTSLDLTGDYEHSVSYAAIAFHPVR